MAPLRRYLRITKYSVLECRIYVDNPALVNSWLLHPRDPVLPRVIESVRPLVLPKLMEERERERAKKRGATKKSKGAIRDVLVEEDFEVSLFLTETNTRHSLLYKHRRARDKTQTRLVSNSSKLTGAHGGGSTSDAPIDVEDGSGGNLRIDLGAIAEDENEGGGGDGDEDIVLTAASRGVQSPGEDWQPPNLLLEDSDAAGEGGALPALQQIPEFPKAQSIDEDAESSTQHRRKRRRQQEPVTVDDSDKDTDNDNDHGSLFGSEDGSGDDEGEGADEAQPSKRRRTRIVPVGADVDLDEHARKKKKLAMDVIYEGFAIYGRVLCLVVKQRGPPRSRNIRSMLSATASPSAATSAASPAPAKPVGQASMENWIASTQLPLEGTGDDGF